jgi:hypothetical protein
MARVATKVRKAPKSTKAIAPALPKRGRGRPSNAELAARIEAARKTNETPAERVARIGERFTVMYRLTQGSITGAVRSLIISGAPGTGKSHTVEHLLSTADERDLIKYETVKGAISAVNLYKLLYRYSKSDQIVLLDDADSIFDDEDAMNIMKAALDTTAVRKISWLSESNALKAEEIPTSFVYEGAMIFITNKDFQGIVDLGKSRMAPHFGALMSRSIYLDLKLHTQEDLIAWISHLVSKNHILVQRGLDRAQESEAIQWLNDNVADVRELSIRTLLKIADFMKTDPTNWETFAKVTLLR